MTTRSTSTSSPAVEAAPKKYSYERVKGYGLVRHKVTMPSGAMFFLKSEKEASEMVLACNAYASNQQQIASLAGALEDLLKAQDGVLVDALTKARAVLDLIKDRRPLPQNDVKPVGVVSKAVARLIKAGAALLKYQDSPGMFRLPANAAELQEFRAAHGRAANGE